MNECEPYLGCATTHELLTELNVRMQTVKFTEEPVTGAVLVAQVCTEFALEHLTAGVLAYRTVGSM